MLPDVGIIQEIAVRFHCKDAVHPVFGSRPQRDLRVCSLIQLFCRALESMVCDLDEHGPELVCLVCQHITAALFENIAQEQDALAFADDLQDCGMIVERAFAVHVLIGIQDLKLKLADIPAVTGMRCPDRDIPAVSVKDFIELPDRSQIIGCGIPAFARLGKVERLERKDQFSHFDLIPVFLHHIDEDTDVILMRMREEPPVDDRLAAAFLLQETEQVLCFPGREIAAVYQEEVIGC